MKYKSTEKFHISFRLTKHIVIKQFSRFAAAAVFGFCSDTVVVRRSRRGFGVQVEEICRRRRRNSGSSSWCRAPANVDEGRGVLDDAG